MRRAFRFERRAAFAIIRRVPTPAPARVILIFGLWLSACAPAATPTLTASPAPTARPSTPTLAPHPTGTPPPPTITPVIAAAETATPTPEPPCTNNANFISDLTVPDGAQFLPGQTFVKKWEVENTGTCDWGPGYRLALVDGDALGAPSEAALYPARGGTRAAWEVSMIAPLTPGQYTGRWQARDPEGNLFGAVVFVKIEVIPLPVTDTPTP
jgi:hypothetical protein